jgi:uncharacterized protein YxjI
MGGKLNKLKQKIMYVVNRSEISYHNKPRAFFHKTSTIHYLYDVQDGTESADTLEIAVTFLSLNFNTLASSQSLMRFFKVLLTAGTTVKEQLLVSVDLGIIMIQCISVRSSMWCICSFRGRVK